jgi:hypothetical protein
MGRDLPASAETQMGVAGGMGVAVGDGRSSMTLLVPPATEVEIEDMARELGIGKADVFSRALALLRLGMRAKEDGMRLAVVDSQGKPQIEITGL